ncbi:MAG: DUF4304 domain-containing protein [Deltaproteobacteria bacterium]|nr:MAG: DUF4304 domain-containing protein [Deltaproteobacteria bacterium]
MSAPAEILDQVLATVAPLLTASGYKKSARNFVALGDGVGRVVQFQTSQLKKPEEATFTINLLVTSVPFYEAYADAPFPKNVASAEPVVSAGIGRLMPDGEAIWWSLEPRVSSALIAKEVGALLQERALPFLARFESEDALLRELEAGDALPGFSAMRERCRAVLLAKRGRKAEAGKVLAALVEANSAEGLEGFRESVNQLARRLGI